MEGTSPNRAGGRPIGEVNRSNSHLKMHLLPARCVWELRAPSRHRGLAVVARFVSGHEKRRHTVAQGMTVPTDCFGGKDPEVGPNPKTRSPTSRSIDGHAMRIVSGRYDSDRRADSRKPWSSGPGVQWRTECILALPPRHRASAERRCGSAGEAGDDGRGAGRPGPGRVPG